MPLPLRLSMSYIVSMTKVPKDKILTIRLTADDLDRIDAAAFNSGRSVADFVRRVVLAQLDKEKPNA